MLFLPSVLNSKPSVNSLASDTEVLLKGEEIVVFGIAVDLFNRFSPNSSLSTVGAACILLSEDDAIDNLRFLEIGADFIENENRQEAEKERLRWQRQEKNITSISLSFNIFRKWGKKMCGTRFRERG